ncbi:hypothetical protein M3484_13840 [Pseudomonas sp. GX19020]|uniref:hypothetical protein n=1 Tax=Pseudomonadota TaxID=1224 RepID=UPI00089510FD|nr:MULTISPECIES: hypothetical protein [Pseudomonadota]MBJ2152222.1 hypothetical protein [Paracoccus sp. IB05]MCL4067654.1 hypothetical protein [Pseudomonas sp. GX19020]SEC50106.1 hypothetical protein SAMN05519105_2703 [Rhodobacter sp. 24-YEA-8]
MSRHLADKRTATTGARVKAFLNIARSKGETGRDTFHKPREGAGPARMQQFLRIARGRTV